MLDVEILSSCGWPRLFPFVWEFKGFPGSVPSAPPGTVTEEP